MNYPQQTLRVLNWLLDLIMPIKCASCGEFSSQNRKEYLCKSCLGQLQIKESFECIGCKITVVLGKTCFDCRRSNFVDQLFIVSDYKNLLTVKLLKLFKYHLIREIAKPLSQAIKKYIIQLNKRTKYNILSENPLIVAVPLSGQRLNWRGFNQSELLAQALADFLNLNTEPSVICRIKNSRPQADIEKKDERLKRMRNVFVVNKPNIIKNRTIVLVDDICTTGATLNECARILKENGTKKVIGFVVARG